MNSTFPGQRPSAIEPSIAPKIWTSGKANNCAAAALHPPTTKATGSFLKDAPANQPAIVISGLVTNDQTEENKKWSIVRMPNVKVSDLRGSSRRSARL